MLKIISEKISLYKNVKNISGFINYFKYRYVKIRELLLQVFKEYNYSETPLKILKFQRVDGIYYIIGKIFQIHETSKVKNIIIEDLETMISIRIFKSKLEEPLKTDMSFLITDIIIGLKIEVKNNRFYCKKIIWPSIKYSFNKENKGGKIYAALASDIHVGSKKFYRKRFLKMIEDVNKIKALKYFIIAGDAIDGIGVYPSQELDLKTTDVYEQYKDLSKLLQNLRSDIKVIISPGNHDYLPILEPQNIFDEKIKSFFPKSTIFVPNPVFFEIEGCKYLIYHGISYDGLISTIEPFSYERPLEVMKFLLKIRHLSPIYSGGSVNLCYKKDFLIIDKKPDIFHTGHIHKFDIEYDADYNVLYCNSGAWQKITDYQKRLGLKVDICKTPIINLKNPSEYYVLKYDTL